MMRFSFFIVFSSLFLRSYSLKGFHTEEKLLSKTLIELNTKLELHILHPTKNDLFHKRPSPLFRLFHDKQKRNRKITAAVLAFPFPFGIVGLHRIYLGCPPYIPVVYIGTLGGVFGALPLIDFFIIVIDKNTENYVNNPQVFMWIK